MTLRNSSCPRFAFLLLVAILSLLSLQMTSIDQIASADERPQIRPSQKQPSNGSSSNSSAKSTTQTFLVDWNDSKRKRIVPAKIYVPPSGDHWPIIIFSHGLGGSRSGYSHYGNLWSQNGFLCVHLEHEGSDGDVMQKGAGIQNMKKLEAAAADPRNAMNRAKDVTFAIDQLIAAHEKGGEGDLKLLKGKLNTKRIGMVGHSFGANTTMLVCGIQSAFRVQPMESLGDPRITAAIAMSIPVNRIDGDALDRMYADVKVPILHLTGTNDSSPIDVQGPEARQLPFEHCRQPDQIMIVFKDGDHAVFATPPGEADNQRSKLLARLRPPAKNYSTIQPIVLETTTQFWKKWLLDEVAAGDWLKSQLTSRVGDAGTVKYKSKGQ